MHESVLNSRPRVDQEVSAAGCISPQGEADWSALATQLQMESPDPLYRRVAMHIENWIERGLLSPGEQLESERRLTEMLRVSRRTIRAALGDLIERGYIRATHGRGNFVNLPPNRRTLRFLALERFAHQRGSMSPSHYDLVHWAETEQSVSVHYKYVPSIKQLGSILMDPPEGYEGILLFRPSQEWLDALLVMQEDLPSNPRVPFLVVGRDLRGSSLNYVSADHFSQAYRATRDLTEAGHQRIGYISGNKTLSYLQLAFNGYLKAMSEAGLAVHEEDHRHFSRVEIENICSDLVPFLQNRRFSAVVVNGSALSLPFDTAVGQAGISVPDPLAAVLVCEEYAMSRLKLCWDTYIYPDRRTINRSLAVLAELSRSQCTPPVQELLAARKRTGISCQPQVTAGRVPD